MNGNKLKYRKEIDGLRALAVIPVILFHSGFITFSGGFVGVDIFFVISGYLITYIIVDELENNSFSLLNFYERRARRIIPALFFVMLCTLPFAWFWLLPQGLKSFSQSLVAVPLFASNVLFYLTINYFDTASELKPLLHTWSLAVEEQYYVLFPLLLMLSWQLGKKWIITLLFSLALFSLSAAQWASMHYPTFNFYLLPTRGFEILIGALACLCAYQKNYILYVSYSVREYVSLTGLVLVLFAIFAFDSNTPSPSAFTLIPTIGASLILIFADSRNLVGRVLGSKIFVGIGLISYSAYLWHQPLLAFARYESINGENRLLLGLMAAMSLFLAYFSWQFIEKPFRDTQLIQRKKFFILVLIGSLFFVTIGLIGHHNGGYQFRLPVNSRDLNLFGDSKTYSGSRVSDTSCFDKLSLAVLSEEVCLASSSSPEILFAGDSHAMALYSSIYGKNIDLDAMLISGHGCPIYPELIYPASFKYNFGNNCKNISEEVLRVAKQFNSIKSVVIVNYFNHVNDEISNYHYEGKNLTNKQAFTIGYSKLIKEFLLMKKKVIFFIDVPHTKFDPKICLQRLPYSSYSMPECRFSTIENTNIRRQYLAEVYKLKTVFPDLIIFDPSSLFCDQYFCEIEKNTRSLYNDKHHISVYSSELVLKKMTSLKLFN